MAGQNGAGGKNPIAEILAGKTVSDIELAGMWWRVRQLTPAEAAQAGLALSMVLSAARPSTEESEAIDRAALNADLIANMQKVACISIVEGSATGRTWYPLRLVPTLDMQDADAGLVFVGALDAATVAAIAVEASIAYRRAKEVGAAFLERQQADADAGQDGEALRAAT